MSKMLTIFILLVLLVTNSVQLLAQEADADVQAKIANAISAGPAVIAEEATILDYPQVWPGNWPDEPADEFVELRAGSNDWTCIPDNPDTPGNDPMCLNETMRGMVLGRYALIDPPSSGIGVGYMLQEGGPVGSPPHLMIFAPNSREDLTAFSTDIDPLTWATGWAMFSETPYVHLMLAAPQPEADADVQAKIENAMSAAPPTISQDSKIMDWDVDVNGDFIVLREGTNEWTCFPALPFTPGNDPQCFDEMWMEFNDALFAGREPNITAMGISYMLQGGSDPSNTDPFAMEPAEGEEWVYSDPHIMLIFPEPIDTTLFTTDPEMRGPFVMWAGTPFEHIHIPVALMEE